MTAEKKVKEEFSDEYVPQSNWMAFDKIGENIKGTLVDKFRKEGVGKYPSQIVYVLKKVDGKCERLGLDGKVEDAQESFNVGIKEKNTYVNSRMKKAKFGQRVGFLFEEEFPATQKGNSPAKSIKPNIWDFDPEYDNLIEKDESFEDGQNEINVEDIPY